MIEKKGCCSPDDVVLSCIVLMDVLPHANYTRYQLRCSLDELKGVLNAQL